MNKNLRLMIIGLTLIAIAIAIPGASTLQVLLFASVGALGAFMSKL